MKKLLTATVLSLIVVLGACSNDEKVKEVDTTDEQVDEQTDELEQEESNTDEDMEQYAEEEQEDEAEYLDATDSVSDILSNPSDYGKFVEGEVLSALVLKEQYTSDESDENGVTDIDIMQRDQVDSDDETFDYKFTLFFAEDEATADNYLLFLGEVENNTSKRVQFNHDFDLIMRDIKQEVDTYSEYPEENGLIDAYEPEFEGEGWLAFPIESDEIPEELEFTFERAWDSDGAGGSGEDEEYLEIEFNLDK